MRRNTGETNLQKPRINAKVRSATVSVSISPVVVTYIPLLVASSVSI